ncbi:MAG: AlkZ family DNA glycosylase [Alphaproteobacteria bacterium]|nr:AlkZ family DNA glycosylase [Alphaproteobacteria bacterium]MBF0374282.1 AlkZ family DNA glycosylase [Alphaproteobacteria bacterium]
MSTQEFSAAHAFTYALRKQYVLPGSGARSIEEIARRLVGVHAARAITPYFAIDSRIDRHEPGDLHDALHGRATLIKARCMRGTLHLLPIGTFGTAHNATLAKRMGVCLGRYRKLGIGERAVEVLKADILASLDQGAEASPAIERLISGRRADGVEAVRAVLKGLWEEGALCCVNATRDFCREQRLYGRMERYYPEFARETAGERRSSIRRLVRDYLAGYGPAMVGDLVWWSGLEKNTMVSALDELGDEVLTLRVRGFDEEFLLPCAEMDEFRAHTPPEDDWVAILAHEDPSLKGYHASRTRYVDAVHYTKLFNAIGESLPAVMLNGRVIGTWSFDRATAGLSWTPFFRIDGPARALIATEFDKMRRRLPDLLGVTRQLSF